MATMARVYSDCSQKPEIPPRVPQGNHMTVLQKDVWKKWHPEFLCQKKKISTDAFITHTFLELCEYSHILSKKSTSGTVQAQGHSLWVPGINTKRQQNNNLLYFIPYSVFLLISGSLPHWIAVL